MAKKEKKAEQESTPKVSIWTHVKTFCKSERTHFIMGVLLFMGGIYLLLSFISFLFTGKSDYSRLNHLAMSDTTMVDSHIDNWTGALGAHLSNLIINEWIGISAFILTVYIICVGLKLMKTLDFKLATTLIYCFLSTIWCSIFFSFCTMRVDSLFINLGGRHGHYVTLWLNDRIGAIGTLLLIISSALAILIVYSAKTIPALRKLFAIRLRKKKSETEETTTDDNGNDDNDDKIEEIEEIPPTVEKSKEEEGKKALRTTPTPPQSDDFEIVIAEDDEWVDNVTDVKKGDSTDDNNATVVKPFEIKHVEDEILDEELEEYDPTLDLSHYKYPGFDLLNKYEGSERQVDMDEQVANKERIINTLEHYGIRISSIKATVGPTITLYEIVPEQGIRISKIRNLGDDIALNLSALGIRIIAPIPGKGTVGIEVPNKDPQIVSMHSIIASRKFQECKYELPIALGKTITNEIFIEDLCKMPHVLVAGATGQGKSVGLNAIITSLLYKKHPAQLKFVLIDPKKVEFNIYSTIERHFLAKLPDEEEPIITDVTKVVQTLNSITKEMDNRYDLLKKAQTRNIKEYNAKFVARKLNPNNGHSYMPYIVVIVDEFGDLIMTAGKEVELPIARIAQLARAVGIHMIIATQRPSTNIITGIIKANFPARVAFKVSSMIDSRTILDCPGANQLIGRGDMLFSKGGDLERVQCAFVDTPEVDSVCDYIGEQQGYPTAFQLPEYVAEGSENNIGEVDLKDRDPMFDEAARLIVANQQGSTSLIQRKFAIGYNRAGRLMDQLEAAGIVGPFEGSKARQVLVIDDMHLEQILNSLQ